jgi:hypothetical protein
MTRLLQVVTTFGVALGVYACGSDSPANSPAVGGTASYDSGGSSSASGSGGASTGGDSPNIGGASTNGGAVTNGGSSGAGGAVANGGSPSRGGATNTTGASTSGGALATGGNSSLGGISTHAGSPSRGGTTGAVGGSVSAGSPSRGGTTDVGGGSVSAGASARGGTAGTGGGSSSVRVSVLEHHNHPSRDGVYVDAAFTLARAATMHIDSSFANALVAGPVYGQPLYLAADAAGPDLVIAASEQNHVYGFDAATGTVVWDQTLARTLPKSALQSLRSGCGNIDPLGVTGTPVIDPATRTIYLDAMTSSDGTAASAKHQVYAVNADTGAIKSGWPVDLNAKVNFDTTKFDSLVQNQRGALTLLGGKVFVPFGGHIFDCSDYHGWIVGISVADPTQVSAWATRAIAGGIWAPGGSSSDGSSIYFSTGNTENSANSFTPPGTWQDGETVFKLPPSLAFSNQNADYWVPTNWQALDKADSDLGGTAPVTFDLKGATPSKLLIALGKDGHAYLLDRTNLGGMAAPLADATVSTGTIINSAAVYTTSSGTLVVFKGAGSGCPSGQSGGLTAAKITAASPPTIAVAWCGGPTTVSSPIVTMTNDQGQDAVVWIVGSDNKLHGLNATTGQSLFSGGASTDAMSTVQGYQTAIVANGRLFAASNTQLYAFAPQ